MGVIPLVLLCAQAVAQTSIAEKREFFENHIRPVLVDTCYRCHGEDPDKLKGGLNLTSREGLLTGGSRGPALAPGDLAASRMMQALEYGNEDLQMPPSGKLPASVLANFRAWIGMGAPDPRDQPFVPGATEDEAGWERIRALRRKWWSFLPIAKHQPPALAGGDWSDHPVDLFILAKLEEAGLSPAPLADARTLIRRLTYVLTGLPPTPEESEQFVAAAALDRQAAVEAAVDRLLASLHFGERWARHWMDWMRYAESHGSEGDPAIPYAWRYRDYLIRALNADVPYDQLVREHLAGDLLPEPRINRELNLNESALGTAQYRFVLHGYSPTDALAEQVRFTENQIDVISKGFLGLTVACARCHNHKFDPISQKDFYALYGIMASSRPASILVDTPERLNTNKAEMAALKPHLRKVLSEAWLAAVDEIPRKLQHPSGPWKEAIEPREEDEEKADQARRSRLDPLTVWRRLRTVDGAAFEQAWAALRDEWQTSEAAVRARRAFDYEQRWDLTGDQAAAWYGHGNGLTAQPSPAGEFHILPEGDRIVGNILPAGMYSHTLSDKHSAILASPRFRVRGEKVFVRVVGGGNAAARYVVQNYPLGGTTYPMTNLKDGVWRWQAWDAAYWQGDHMHIEIATAADQPARARVNQARSWFGITEALVVAEGQPEPRDELADFIAPLFEWEGTPTGAKALAERYAGALRACLLAWRDGSMKDAQALFLDYFLGAGLLPNSVDEVPAAASLLTEYRQLESEVPVPRRAPGVLEGDPFDQPLFIRGDHRQPGDPVPRRFLEVIDDTPYHSEDAGRTALAESILHPDNPLTSRVIVNRLWHHIFGSGIVATPDNFGRLGETPSHPELLDDLAARFVDDGWSIKALLRFLVLSRTFQLSATPSARAKAVDPSNRLLSHAGVRRLEGEAIRDGMLMVAGRLDTTPFGKPVDGRANRRSVYVRVIRNKLDPFLSVFDVPVPTSTVGRRNATNVPAQALAMMNAPLVIDLAGSFASRMGQEDPNGRPEQRITRMFELALGRLPRPEETARARAFLVEAAKDGSSHRNEQWAQAEIAKRRERIVSLTSKTDKREKVQVEREIEQLVQRAGTTDPWHELAHAIFCMKEFIYLR